MVLLLCNRWPVNRITTLTLVNFHTFLPRRLNTLTRDDRPPQCPVWVCAVQRRRFPVGANPIRQPLQPEALGAVMEVTKWLKPSIAQSATGFNERRAYGCKCAAHRMD